VKQKYKQELLKKAKEKNDWSTRIENPKNLLNKGGKGKFRGHELEHYNIEK
jgi:hypothetical protein